MKLKVLKAFKDKETGEMRKVGEVIEVTDERGAELLNHPLELVAESKEVKKPRRKKS
jgi:hypothetical protein